MPTPTPTPLPDQLRTARLTLRPHRAADAPFMVRLNSDPEVVRWTGDGPLDLDGARAVIRYLHTRQHPHGMARLIVEHEGRPIGWCGLRRLEPGEVPDLGYRFLRSVWGRGFATEAAVAVLAHGFTLADVTRVKAEADARNPASVRVMERLGMTCDGHFKDEDGPYVRYTLDRAAWLEGRDARAAAMAARLRA